MVLEWFNSECPFVQKHYESGNMQSLQKKYGDKGVVWLTINSTSPDSSNYRNPAHSQQIVRGLEDQLGGIDARHRGHGRADLRCAHHAAHVGDRPEGKVIYTGGIDDKATYRADDVKTASNFVAVALDESMSGKPVSVPSAAPYGCSVKYKH